MAGRLTRLRTSPIASGMSSRCGATCSANCMMPTPSIAAAIITPARLDLDSRMSRVIIALPAPSCISCGELVEPRLPAGLGGVAAEARAERGVDEQALDQLGGDVGFSGGHGYPLTRSTSGFPSTTKTGTKSASQSVPSTTCTTHDGANWDMIGS